MRFIMEQFRRNLEAFLASSGIAASSFGREVLGDPSFVSRIRAGAECLPSTVARVETAIAEMSQHEKGAVMSGRATSPFRFQLSNSNPETG